MVFVGGLVTAFIAMKGWWGSWDALVIVTYECTFLLVALLEYSVLVLGRGPGEQGCFLNPEDEDEDEDK